MSIELKNLPKRLAMIDTHKIQIRKSCPQDLESLFLGQLSAIAAGETMWGWSPMAVLLRSGLENSGLSDLIMGGLKCVEFELVGLSYHMVLLTATDKGNSCNVSARIEVIADCLGISIGTVELLVKTKPPEQVLVQFSPADN
jgi:hypothetical protein